MPANRSALPEGSNSMGAARVQALRGEFELGAVLGFFTALFGMAAWLMFTYGVGVTGDKYDWPFHALQTDVWFAGDVLVTLAWALAAVLVFGAFRLRDSRRS